MKFITYHSNSSNGIGGIEELVRSLQLIAHDSGLKSHEIYLKEDTGDFFKSLTLVKKIKPKGEFNKTSFINRFSRALFLRKVILEIDVGADDFIVIFDPKQLLLVPRRVRVNCKVILVQTNRIDKLFESFFSKIALSFLYKSISAFTVYTHEDKRELVSLYPGLKNRIKIIPRACKLDKASEVAIFSKRLVTVARIQENQKNFTAMIEIFKSLPSSYNLEIYGDGTNVEVENLRVLISGNERIQYMGVARDVASALRKNSIFIMTSHFEGFGQTLIEARSQGLPLIVYDTFKAASWIVKNDSTGFLIKYNDVSGFVNKINYLTNDKEVYNQFSMRSLLVSSETDKVKVDEMWRVVLNDVL